MAFITRRSFLIIPPAAVGAAWLGVSQESLEALDVPALAGAQHASGAAAKGFRHAQLTRWVSIVHALASDHPECADEIALLHEFRHDQRFQLAGLFVRDSESRALDFIRRTGNPYDALGFDADGRAERLLGVREVPTTFILDAHGEIIHVRRGALTRTYFEQTMLPIIEQAAPATALMANRAGLLV